MATGSIVSKLKKVIDSLPDDWAMKSDSVENYLTKQGVKPEELKWAELQIPSGGRLSKADLQRIEQARTDQFTVQSDGQAFMDIGLPEGSANVIPNFNEWENAANQLVRNWDSMHPFDIEEEANRLGYNGPIETDSFNEFIQRIRDFGPFTPGGYKSPKDPNYSMDVVGFKQNKADEVMTVFSQWENGELNNAQALENARRLGFDGSAEDLSKLDEYALSLQGSEEAGRYISSHVPEEMESNYLYHTRGFDRELDGQPTRVVQEIQSDLHQQGRQKGYGTDVPESPLEKNWLRKGIERELVRAANEGKTQIAIPISGKGEDIPNVKSGIENLARSSGVQKWYETKVAPTAKKIAKSLGGKYRVIEETRDKITTMADIPIIPELEQAIELTKKLRSMEDAGENTMQIVDEVNEVFGKVYGFYDQYPELRDLQLGSINEFADVVKGLAKNKEAPLSSIDYAVIELPKDEAGKVKPFQTELYSPAAAGLGAGALTIQALEEQNPEQVKQAREAGYSDKQIQTYLNSKAQQQKVQIEELPTKAKAQTLAEGFTEAQLAAYQRRRAQSQAEPGFATPADQFRRESDVPQVSESGEITFGLETLPEEEVRKVAKEIGVDPKTQEGINRVYNTVKRRQVAGRGWADLVSEDIADFEEVTNVDRPWAWFKSNFGPEANNEYQAMKQDTVNSIIQMGKERGVDLIYEEDEWLVRDPNNPDKAYPVTPGILESMGSAKYEIGGAIAGAAGAARLTRGLEQAGLPGRIAKMLAVGAGATVGAVAGDQLDYLEAAIDAQQTWDSKLAAEKAIGTTQISIVGEVIGYGIFKAGAKSWDVLKNAYNHVIDGNTEGAYKALRESLGGISDDEAQEIVARWERLNQKVAPGKNQEEKALAVLPTTTPGGEQIVGTAATIDPRASAAVYNEVNSRAQSLLGAVRNMRDADSGAKVLDDLNQYELSVKTMFDQVRTQGENLVPDEYRFDIESLAVRPLIEHKIATIQDPAVVNSMVRVLDNVDAVTDSRSFADLLELRTVVNDLKYNRNIKSKKDYEAVNESLATINSEIKRVMKTIPDGKQWLDDWKEANSEYAKFKGLQENALFKTVTRKGMSEEAIAKQMLKYGKSIDTTYAEVMGKLTPTVRKGVENSIVDQLVTKHSLGKEGEFSAIHFPELAKSLETYKFMTPDAERIKTVVDRMAEVYRNDPKLAAISGKITLPQFQSYLTTDPIVRAKYEAASTVFNYVKRLIPGGKSDSLSLVNKVAKLLEKPLNAKTTTQVLEAVKEDQELTAAIKRMQSEVAKASAEGKLSQPATKFYESKSGQLYLRPGEGRRELDEAPIPTHRLVGEGEVKAKLGVKKLRFSDLTKAKKLQLLNEGYGGIVLDNGQVVKLY